MNISAAEDFTCQCAPGHEQGEFHRIPIDCVTVEDIDRRQRTVYVVAWVGDEDCGGRNDGPIAVYRNRTDAYRRALKEAEDASTDLDPVMPDVDGFAVGRGSCVVRHFLLEPDRAS